MKKRYTYFLGLCSLLYSVVSIANPATMAQETVKTVNSLLQKQEKNQPLEKPLFNEGKDYFTYKKPINVSLPQDKIFIQYFYKYGCKVCLVGLDSLNLYADIHANKVILKTAPSFEKGENFTSAMNATFKAYGRAELSPLYLFDSVDRKEVNSLTSNNEAISSWLKQHDIDPSRFNQLFHSDEIKKQVEEDVEIFKQYSAPSHNPIAIINGKYILLGNTLSNDDYTFGVLDFLVNKIQQEQEEKHE